MPRRAPVRRGAASPVTKKASSARNRTATPEGPLEQFDMLRHALGAERPFRDSANGRHQFFPGRAVIPAGVGAARRLGDAAQRLLVEARLRRPADVVEVPATARNRPGASGSAGTNPPAGVPMPSAKTGNVRLAQLFERAVEVALAALAVGEQHDGTVTVATLVLEDGAAHVRAPPTGRCWDRRSRWAMAASRKRSNTAWSLVSGNWRNAAPPKMTRPTRSPGSWSARSFASALARSSRVPSASCTSIERDRSSATRRSRPERPERVSFAPPWGRASARSPAASAAVARSSAWMRRARGSTRRPVRASTAGSPSEWSAAARAAWA